MVRFRQCGMAVVAASMLCCACDRRQLEVTPDEHVRAKITVKWDACFKSRFGYTPEQTTFMVWDDLGNAPITRTSFDNSVLMTLDPGTYQLVAFNEIADTYNEAGLHFYNSASYERMALRSLTYADEGTSYMYPPKTPGIAVVLDTFQVTRDMVEGDTVIFVPYEEFRDKGYRFGNEHQRTFELPETPWLMTVDLSVTVKLKHWQSVKAVNGSISGMADGFYLSRVERTRETGLLHFDPNNWSRTRYGSEADSTGSYTTRIASYGLPLDKELISERKNTDNVLRLALTLSNDSVVNCQYNVGKLLRYSNAEGKETRIRTRRDLQGLQLNLELPDVINLPVIGTRNNR